MKNEGKYIGLDLRRTEDDRLLMGKGMYVDDIKLDGCYHVAFLRSPYAHANINNIRTVEALALDGVIAAFTGEDLVDKVGYLPLMSNVYPGVMEREKPIIKPQMQRALAYKKARYVGEPVAAIVAISRAVAEDALELIQIDYEPLTVVNDPYKAMKKESPILFEEWGDNIAVSYEVKAGNVEKVLKNADFIIREKFKVNRQSGNPIETRGVLTNWDIRTNSLTMWSSTQMPHRLQYYISECLSIPKSNIRVVAPDVGGGFGPKALIYSEEIALAYFATVLKKPLKWIEDRLEHMKGTAHSRDQHHFVEVGFQKDGTIIGLRDELILDTGAYNLYGVNTSYNTAAHLPGPYRLDHYTCNVKVISTNKVPCSQYRGAGRPEAVFVMDRIIDLIAKQLNMDPADVRIKNMITKEEMPYDTGRLYKDGEPLIYDSGDYVTCFHKALEEIDYHEFRSKQEQYRKEGKYIGVGLSAYVEGTGQGPHDGCRISIDSSGSILCGVSTASQGQGHQTTWAQICAEYLDVPMEQIQIVTGDTAAVKYGSGTYGSRSAVVGGNAIVKACKSIKKKAIKIASILLETSKENLIIGNGRVFLIDKPDVGYTYAELAKWAEPNKLPLKHDIEPGLSVEEYFVPSTATYSNGVHAALVEVDIESGKIEIIKYVVSHDSGKIINPMIAEGQIAGGVAQGIGGAVYEEIVYDDNGQIVTGTYMDYLLPTASEIPDIISIHMESPSTRNSLGVKGVGEGGTISPPAVLANAVEDALRSFDIKINSLPLSPNYIWNLVNESSQQNKQLVMKSND
ncbi:xanthine dehydrogenase family protein molybdopterin-binding subunit [Niallia sp. Krafla_26]|uniref:xanthine dehydrogenase family protein molybdopterin-binding subunit n=1 Tax=Niallia sp. Krafla_26 TaxID=3064703 RepID=UPI003D170493